MVWVLVAIVVVVVVLLAVAGVLLARKRRSRQLKEGFGPEYEREVQQRGDPEKAEAALADREARVHKLTIRDLPATERAAYADEWAAVQRRFVDDPSMAVNEADRLVNRVMNARGYPMADFDQRAADISVDHPVVTENYRAAQAISEKAESGQASTEELRQSLVHFRALFDDLLAEDDGSDGNGATPGARGKTTDETTARR